MIKIYDNMHVFNTSVHKPMSVKASEYNKVVSAFQIEHHVVV